MIQFSFTVLRWFVDGFIDLNARCWVHESWRCKLYSENMYCKQESLPENWGHQEKCRDKILASVKSGGKVISDSILVSDSLICRPVSSCWMGFFKNVFTLLMCFWSEKWYYYPTFLLSLFLYFIFWGQYLVDLILLK